MVSLQKLPLSRYKHSETDDIRSKYGAIYGVFYGSILTPRISGGVNACADSVYQALFSAYEKEPGVEASPMCTHRSTLDLSPQGHPERYFLL